MKKPNTTDTPVRLLARMAAAALRGNDLEPEDLPEVACLLETVAETGEPAEEQEIHVSHTEAEIPDPEPAENSEEPVPANDADPEILSRLDRIISLLETMGTVPIVSKNESLRTVPTDSFRNAGDDGAVEARDSGNPHIVVLAGFL